MHKIMGMAKAENKLVKICADNWRVLGMLKDQLPGVEVAYGLRGVLEQNEA